MRSDGAVFTVATLGRYHYHDVFHHLHDVTALAERRDRGVLRRVRRRLRRRHQRDARRGGRQHRPVRRRGRLRRTRARDRQRPRPRRPGAGADRAQRAAHRHQPGLRAPPALGRLRRRPARPAARRPDRPAARRGAVRRGVGQRLAAPRRAREPAGRAAPAGRRHPSGRHPPRDAQGGRRRDAGRCTATSAPRGSSPSGARTTCATLLLEAGWRVDEVRRGESTPVDRPSESWLAVFATRE